ncbi:macrophage migration inhibitory factor [Moniliophthora roreri MCA 2997]|uniref:L-dopachrome isomerase n=1 Tax=Moniliophthora roreri (strain MCA 2997) TaxID=1381753 RepID=V2YC37_MONRO|nr:macrophage migration inhibitory factor [Moniliophthora roreri MCA 2997]
MQLRWRMHRTVYKSRIHVLQTLNTMPIITFETNVKIHNPDAFAMSLSETFTPFLGFPEQYVQITINEGKAMTFGRSTDPICVCSIVTIKAGEGDHNERVIGALTEFAERKLGICSDRQAIVFLNPGKKNIGFQGQTLDVLMPELN